MRVKGYVCYYLVREGWGVARGHSKEMWSNHSSSADKCEFMALGRFFVSGLAAGEVI